jgi:hypothetical protein
VQSVQSQPAVRRNIHLHLQGWVQATQEISIEDGDMFLRIFFGLLTFNGLHGVISQKIQLFIKLHSTPASKSKTLLDL